MRLIHSALFTSFLVPTVALALTIQPGNLYTDVRSSSPEAAGINMLTREGIIQGYGNNFFGFSRQINRAEFLKIAMTILIGKNSNAFGGYDWYKNGKVTGTECFPDVALASWFGPSVCEAFDAGFVRGNPDGLFHPERTVNYAEALKMLTLMFGYDIPSVQSLDWAEPYYRAAAAKQVDLPITIRFDTPLTRSLSARLIAAFLAESNGQLSDLRLAEAGQYAPPSSSSSMSSSAVSSSVSSSSSSSTMSSSSAPASLFTLPSVSHFLILGKKSDAIADMTIRSNGETSAVFKAQVKLYSEVLSVDTLELVRADNGLILATLRKRTTSDLPDYKQTYEVEVPSADRIHIPADTDIPLAVRANIRGFDTNGASEQLLEVRSMSVTLQGDRTNTANNIPGVAPFPRHQTSFGLITGARLLSPKTDTLRSGTGLVIGAFGISGSVLSGKSLAVEHLTFAVMKTGQVDVSHWSLRRAGSLDSIPCSVSQDGLIVSCPNLGSMGVMQSSSALALEVTADVRVPPASGSSLQITLDAAGSPTSIGSIQWTDGSGHFRWIEGKSPVVSGTLWR